MSETPLTIDPATPEDARLVLDLIRELAAYERLADTVLATESDIRKTLFGRRRAAEVLIARWEGEPAGFALYFTNYSTFVGRPGLYLEDLFVRTDFRMRGIGRALLRHLARIALERAYGRMEWAVLDWNVDAIRFYASLGARPMADWTLFRLDGEGIRNLAG